MDNTSRIDIEINSEDMQSLQDAFCRSNDMYMICISKLHGQITSFSGSKSEEDFVESNFTDGLRSDILESFVDNAPENIIERVGAKDYFMYSGVAIRDEAEHVIGTWICFGIDKNSLPESVQIPDEMRTTTRELFDKSVGLIESLTKFYFAQKHKTHALEEQLQLIESEGKQYEDKLLKNKIMTDILRLMESENSFAKVVDDILKEAGEYIGCSNAMLIQLSAGGKTADVITEWCKNAEDSILQKLQNVNVEDLPFLTGKPYTISSDASLPDAFKVFFEEYSISAAILMPINVNDNPAMYLGFLSIGEKRQWSVEDIRFSNDIKRIIHTILIKKITANSLASSYSALESILKNAGYGVVVADADKNQILYTNSTFDTMFENEIDRVAVEELIFDKRYTISDLNGYSANGSGKWFDISLNTIKWVDDREVRLITFYDITELRIYQKKVEKQAMEDVLTGLYNRQACEKDISMEYHVATKLNKEFAVLMLDVDDFTGVNEGLGYRAGDELLEFIAHSLNDITPIRGKCYRVGGDEFAILVDHDNIKSLDLIIARIMNLFDNPWKLDGQDYYCTISMGGVKAPADIKDSSAILTRLTIALHGAKNKGKNRFEFYNEKADEIVAEKVKFEQSLRKAVDDGCKEFEVHYQPIMELIDGIPNCCGAEALLRWNSDKYGVLMPERFISEAENLKLIVAIGDHVMYQAAKECKHWNDFGQPDYKVNINISTIQLAQSDFLDKLDTVLKKTGVNPKNLTLEVTENVAIEDIDKIVKILDSIRALGCRVALDDFGTGYSSLNYIRKMPIDTIKIDKAFVSEMKDDIYSQVFVKTISELADSLDVDVCVEGVEDDKQINLIGSFSVNLAQGYYFDKPLIKEDFESKYV